MVSDAVASAVVVARARRVRVVAEPVAYPMVAGSEPELGRVLRNLLANAIRHTPPDGTVVELSWYGDRRVEVPLGEFFHSRRLTIRIIG